MPSRQKPAQKKQLAMPHDEDDSEVDEFEDERRQRGMYDDSDEQSQGDALSSEDEGSEDDDGSEAESSAMARRRWQGWEKDELDGQEEEFTDASESDEEGSGQEDSEGEAPRSRSSKSDQERLASLRKSESLLHLVLDANLTGYRLSDLEQVPLSELLKAQRKLNAKQSHGSDSESDSAPETTPSVSGSANKNRLEQIKRQLLLLQQKKGKALDVEVPRVQEEYAESDAGSDNGDPRDGGEGSRNNLWQVRKERKEDRAREREKEEKWAADREKRKRDGKHA